MIFESLDYLYVPAPDIDAAIRFYTGAAGGELVWRIRDGSVQVAAVRVDAGGPLVLLASHLEPHHTILIYRVQSLEAIRLKLREVGWTEAGESLEIPQGPCLILRDPAGQRLAVYQRVRPWMDDTFKGRFDG